MCISFCGAPRACVCARAWQPFCEPPTHSTSQSGCAPSSCSSLRSSATISCGRATPSRSRRSLARSCSVQGSTTAPMRKQAIIVSTHSGRLPIKVITTSPRPTLRARKAFAVDSASASTSPKVHSRRVPSRASSTSARSAPGRSASRSTAKFTVGSLPRSAPPRLAIARFDASASGDSGASARFVSPRPGILGVAPFPSPWSSPAWP